MAVIAEKHESRAATVADDPTATLLYVVRGTDDGADVRALVSATAPLVYEGLAFDSFSIDPVWTNESAGDGVWDVTEKSSEFLDQLEHLAERAGGEPPLPARPSVTHLADLRSLAGNERLVKMLDGHDTLKANATDWKKAAETAESRVPIWGKLQRLTGHGDGLGDFDNIKTSADGIRDGRLLLDGSDHVTPLAKKGAAALRTAVTAAHKQFCDAHAGQLKTLQESDSWQKIADGDRDRILREEGIDDVPNIAVGSDEELLSTLDATPLGAWRDKSDALGARFSNAATKAAKLLEPKTQRVHLTSGTLKTEEDVRQWIDGQREELLTKVKDGPIVIT